jgi:hypothetical protein
MEMLHVLKLFFTFFQKYSRAGVGGLRAATGEEYRQELSCVMCFLKARFARMMFVLTVTADT